MKIDIIISTKILRAQERTDLRGDGLTSEGKRIDLGLVGQKILSRSVTRYKLYH